MIFTYDAFQNLNLKISISKSQFQNLNFKSLARFSYQLSRSQPYVTSQNLITILRDKHKMILNLVDRVATISIVHRLTSSPNMRRESIIAKADRLKPVVLTF